MGILPTGKFVEILMNNLLKFLGLPLPRTTNHTKEFLLSNLPLWRKRLVEKGYRFKTGKVLNWDTKDSEWILDKAYKIDKLLEVRPNEYYSLDLTSDPDTVEKKIKDIQRLMPYLNNIGVSKSAVVLVLVDDDLDLTKLNHSHLESKLWHLIDQIELSTEVVSFVFDLQS